MPPEGGRRSLPYDDDDDDDAASADG